MNLRDSTYKQTGMILQRSTHNKRSQSEPRELTSSDILWLKNNKNQTVEAKLVYPDSNRTRTPSPESRAWYPIIEEEEKEENEEDLVPVKQKNNNISAASTTIKPKQKREQKMRTRGSKRRKNKTPVFYSLLDEVEQTPESKTELNPYLSNIELLALQQWLVTAYKQKHPSSDTTFHVITPLPISTFNDLFDEEVYGQNICGSANSGVQDYYFYIVNPHTSESEKYSSTIAKVDHWILIIIGTLEKEMIVMDSLLPSKKTGCNQPDISLIALDKLNFYNELMSNHTRFTSKSYCYGLQTDSNNCGIWCLEFIRHFIASASIHNLSTVENFYHLNINIKDVRRRWTRVWKLLNDSTEAEDEQRLWLANNRDQTNEAKEIRTQVDAEFEKRMIKTTKRINYSTLGKVRLSSSYNNNNVDVLDLASDTDDVSNINNNNNGNINNTTSTSTQNINSIVHMQIDTTSLHAPSYNTQLY